MSDKKAKTGIFAFVAGMAAGAAALFFSKKENRDRTKEAVDDTVKKAKKLQKDLKDNPEKVKKEAQQKVEKVVDQAKEEVAKKLKQ